MARTKPRAPARRAAGAVRSQLSAPLGSLVSSLAGVRLLVRSHLGRRARTRLVTRVVDAITSRGTFVLLPGAADAAAVAASAHAAWVGLCPCANLGCIHRAMGSPVAARALRKSVCALGKQLQRAKVLARVARASPLLLALSEGWERTAAARGAKAAAAAAAAVAADPTAALTADSLPAVLTAAASAAMPLELLEETLAVLGAAAFVPPPLLDPRRTFRSLFAAPWYPALRELSTPRLLDIWAAAGFLALPLATCEPLVREGAQRLANESVYGPEWGSPAAWGDAGAPTYTSAIAVRSVGVPAAQFHVAVSACFSQAVSELFSAPRPALLRHALAPTSAAAVGRMQGLLKIFGESCFLPDFKSLELEERQFLATARGRCAPEDGSLVAAVLFGHAPISQLGRLKRSERTEAWELMVGWGGLPRVGSDLEGRAAAQYVTEFADEAAGRPHAAPSLTRMLIEVVQERLGWGQPPATIALLDAAAAHVPAVFRRFQAMHKQPSAWSVLRSTPVLEDAFKRGDAAVVAWVIDAGLLKNIHDEDGGQGGYSWDLSEIAEAWLTARALPALRALFAVEQPSRNVCSPLSGDVVLKLRGAEWALYEACDDGDDALLEWALAEIFPKPAKPLPSWGFAAVLGAVDNGSRRLLARALAAGCSMGDTAAKRELLVMSALCRSSRDVLVDLWRAGLDLTSISPPLLYKAYAQSLSENGDDDGECAKSAKLLASLGVRTGFDCFVAALSYLRYSDLADIKALHRVLCSSLPSSSPPPALPAAWTDGDIAVSIVGNSPYHGTGVAEVLAWCCDDLGCTLNERACAELEKLHNEDGLDIRNDVAGLAKWRTLIAANPMCALSGVEEGSYCEGTARVRAWLLNRIGGCPCGGGLHTAQSRADKEWEAHEDDVDSDHLTALEDSDRGAGVSDG